ATMVTAGMYLIARTHALFMLAPAVQAAVAAVGAASLLLAARGSARRPRRGRSGSDPAVRWSAARRRAPARPRRAARAEAPALASAKRGRSRQRPKSRAARERDGRSGSAPRRIR